MRRTRGGVLLAAGLVLAAGALVYANSYDGVMLFDDFSSIRDNPNVKSLWPIWGALWAPRELTISGRPTGSLTLAINYAISREQVWSYHVLNLLVHLVGALALLEIVRRTLESPPLRERFGRAALPLATVVALLWTVHPIQTEAVTYIVQRVESLMGMFFLLTLYCAIRGFHSERPSGWYAGAVACCSLGMASKEVMAGAPLIVLLYDGLFVSPRLRDSLRRRWRFYAALGCTWFILGALVATGPRTKSAGFGLRSVGPAEYAVTQPEVILHYLGLSLWPKTLVLDYGWPPAPSAGQVALPAGVILGLVAGTVWLLWRRQPLGFLGAWLFVILAPTSSIVPLLDLAFEHRMYLPLAAVVTLAVLLAYRLGGAAVRRWLPAPVRARAGWVAGCLAAAAVATALSVRTWQRNGQYRDEKRIWGDTADQRPFNARAQHNFGVALVQGKEKEYDRAIQQYRKAVALEPGYYLTYNSLGALLVERGSVREAVPYYQRALLLDPNYADAHNNLGLALDKLGDSRGALEHFQRAVEIKPGFAEAHSNLGMVLVGQKRIEEAMPHHREALRLDPDLAKAHHNYAKALFALGKALEAMDEYRQAVRLDGDLAESHQELGNGLVWLGRYSDAIQEFRQVVRIRPEDPEGANRLAWLLAAAPDSTPTDAQEALELARRVCQSSTQPNPGYLDTLAVAYAATGQFDQAVAETEKAIAQAAEKDPQRIPGLQYRLGLYRSGRAFRMPRPVRP